MNSEVVSVRLPIWAAQWLKDRARTRGTSVNAMLVRFITDRIAEVQAKERK